MSNKQDNRYGYGYIYRKADLTEQGLRDLIEEYLFPPSAGEVFAFAANSVDLAPLVACSSVTDVALHREHFLYDFGHVFSDKIEVRWKHNDDLYDALVLIEQEQPELVREGFACIAERLIARRVTGDKGIVLSTPADVQRRHKTPADVQRRHKQWRLGYVEYRHHANKVVQFVRYTQREEVARYAR